MVGEQQHVKSVTIRFAGLACRPDTSDPRGNLASRPYKSVRKQVANLEDFQTINHDKVSIRTSLKIAGRPNKSFWGEQPGLKLVMLESLNDDDKEDCPKVLETETNLIMWWRANPSKKTKAEQVFRYQSYCIIEGNGSKIKSGGSSKTEPEGGKHVTRARRCWRRGDVETFQHVRPIPTWTKLEWNCKTQNSSFCGAQK